MRGKRRKQPSWIRFSGIGVEFAAAVGGLTLIGYWIGRHYGKERWGVLIGALVGIVGGGYNLIREALLATKEAEHSDTNQDGDEGE